MNTVRSQSRTRGAGGGAVVKFTIKINGIKKQRLKRLLYLQHGIIVGAGFDTYATYSALKENF